MKFKFPLQKVMQHRKTLEDLAQRDFQEAQAELNRQIEILKQMEGSVLQAREAAFRQQSEGGKASPALTQVHEFLGGQDIRMDRQKAKIKECESLVENLREILRQKVIDYKIIEELREKRLKEFKVERNKREQKLADDNSLMRYRRGDVGK